MTNSLAEQPVPDLPGEHAGTLGLGSGKMSYFSSSKFPFLATLYSEIFLTTAGVEILGFDPPISRGLMLPVS